MSFAADLKVEFMSLREDLIYLPALLMDMGTSSAILGATFYASKLGASPLVIGVMASSSTALYVFLSRVFGKLSDRVSRKRMPQIASLLFSVLYFLIPLCKNLRQLMALFPLTGVTLAVYWPAFEAWIGGRGDGRPLVKRVRMFNLSWTFGVMLGYAGGGYIYDLHPFAPFYFSCIAALCAFAAITIQPNDLIRHETRDVRHETRDIRHKSRVSSLKSPSFLYLSWAAIFVSWLALGVMRYIFPKLIDQLGMAPRVFGLLMLCWAGAQFFMFFILGATEKWHYRYAPMLLFQILASLGFISIWITDSPFFWAPGLIFFGINTGMIYFSSIFYSLSGHADLGSKSGWHESILSSGALLGPFVGGALANYVSIKSPYLFCAAAIILGLPVQLLILHRRYK